MNVSSGRGRIGGFSLPEVMMALAILGLALGGMVYGYLQAAERAEWSGFSLAAHSLALQGVEQCRAAKWDALACPPVDMLVSSNFPVQVNVLDIPISGTNVLYATNITTITLLSTSPPLKLIRVDCTWRFRSRGLFTNTILTYRGPDQ